MDKTLRIIKEIRDYNKGSQETFPIYQKLIKGNQNQSLKKPFQREQN